MTLQIFNYLLDYHSLVLHSRLGTQQDEGQLSAFYHQLVTELLGEESMGKISRGDFAEPTKIDSVYWKACEAMASNSFAFPKVH